MEINGTLINYYFHCKRQCYLFGNRLNLEDNSEEVKIGKVIHEEKEEKLKNTEIKIDNISIDGLTDKYLIEIKKSDADIEACTWQILFYLKVLKSKGVFREGKLEFDEKNKQKKQTLIVELTEEKEKELDSYVEKIKELLEQDAIPEVLHEPKCKKCAYFEYCCM